ncbi:MAG: hypothetical protein K8F31_08145 [Roseovarius sp.]|nr:hypothetical protein [Roseovarius sp.]
MRRHFTLSHASLLAGVNAQTLKSWLAKGWASGNFKGGEGAGNKRLFTWENIAEFSLVASANRLFGTRDMPGLFRAANFYAYGSGGGEAYGLPDRLPGFPYHYNHGKTWVALTPNGYFDMPDAPHGEARNVLEEFKRHVSGPGFVTINMSDVFYSQCAAIDLDPREVLAKEYGEGSPLK